jgi:hypothetical protein
MVHIPPDEVKGAPPPPPRSLPEAHLGVDGAAAFRAGRDARERAERVLARRSSSGPRRGRRRRPPAHGEPPTAAEQMVHFLNTLAGRPDVARALADILDRARRSSA